MNAVLHLVQLIAHLGKVMGHTRLMRIMYLLRAKYPQVFTEWSFEWAVSYGPWCRDTGRYVEIGEQNGAIKAILDMPDTWWLLPGEKAMSFPAPYPIPAECLVFAELLKAPETKDEVLIAACAIHFQRAHHSTAPLSETNILPALARYENEGEELLRQLDLL